MSSVPEIEQAVRQLTPEELAQFRQWFARYDASQWDSDIEADVTAGLLDAFADEAVAEVRAGGCKEL